MRDENLTYAYVALLDILGYKQRLTEDKKTGVAIFKNDLRRAMAVLDDINITIHPYQAISDTIIISCPQRELIIEFLNVIKRVFVSFLGKKMFIRGGISYNQHFRSQNITYSHAIAGAYELETNLAIYPRIVIDPNIILMFEGNQNLIDSKLVCETNGVYVLNVLDAENWSSVYEAARSLYEAQKQILIKDERPFQKHRWFEDYLLSSPYANAQGTRYIPQPNLLG